MPLYRLGSRLSVWRVAQVLALGLLAPPPYPSHAFIHGIGFSRYLASKSSWLSPRPYLLAALERPEEAAAAVPAPPGPPQAKQQQQRAPRDAIMVRREQLQHS